jgi:hypothetical protein
MLWRLCNFEHSGSWRLARHCGACCSPSGRNSSFPHAVHSKIWTRLGSSTSGIAITERIGTWHLLQRGGVSPFGGWSDINAPGAGDGQRRQTDGHNNLLQLKTFRKRDCRRFDTWTGVQPWSAAAKKKARRNAGLLAHGRRSIRWGIPPGTSRPVRDVPGQSANHYLNGETL